MGRVKEITIIVQELCESRRGRPGLSMLTSLLVSVDVIEATLNHAASAALVSHSGSVVPNMSTDI